MPKGLEDPTAKFRQILRELRAKAQRYGKRQTAPEGWELEDWAGMWGNIQRHLEQGERELDYYLEQ